MKASSIALTGLSVKHQHERAMRARLLVASLITATVASPAFAQLTEGESLATWVLGIFSPALMLTLLTILLIGCGIAVYLGKLSGGLFVKILIGSLMIFGARTIAPKIIALF